MRNLILIAAASAALSACATGPVATFDPNGSEWTGWVRFTSDEFQLYANENQVLQPFSRPCLSGALPRDEQRQYRELSGTKVQVTGRTTPWSANQSGARIEHEGSVVRNDCGGAVVILADDMKPVA